MASQAIESPTCRLAAKCLNQLRQRYDTNERWENAQCVKIYVLNLAIKVHSYNFQVFFCLPIKKIGLWHNF